MMEYQSKMNDKILIAPKGKGFQIFRGDTAKKIDDKVRETLYDIGKPLRPSIGRSWTTSYKQAKEFACEYAEYTEYPIVPIIYYGLTNKMLKGLFWDSEKEVHILRGKSKLKKIEIIDKAECKKILEEMRI